MATAIAPPPPAPGARLGDLLRQWRGVRGMSQLALALEAEISSRHLSFVETGKAQPSREMVARLADALRLPLRERNAMLVAAGYAPMFRETALSMPEMDPVRRAMEFILAQQEPFPALVLNRYQDVLLANTAAGNILARVAGRPARHGNVLKQIFDPEDMRPFVANWEEVAGQLLHHLHSEILAAPTDARARALLQEVLAYPDIPPHWRTREPGLTPVPILTCVLRGNGLSLTFFSVFSTFGTPRDITLDEMMIETLFPADEGTREFCVRVGGER